jgi:pimeloyl-ACP methyl ester carboxylesterase
MSDATSRVAIKRATPSRDDARFSASPASIHRIEVDGVQMFYRVAGETNAPTILLLHGFPTSSFMFRELIPRLANEYRVIAPDLPGFGFTEVPSEQNYSYSFDRFGVDDRRLHTGT